MNYKKIEESNKLLGDQTVEMLLKVHQDALWILENMGVGCKQPDIMVKNCSKPLYVAVTSDKSLARACEIYESRNNIMIVSV